MGIFMLATMPAMLSNRPLNIALHLVFALLTAGAFFATRWQVAVGDHQFIASMVPHHSGAILMCREAALSDPELVKLCSDIARAQRQEIRQMDAIRARLERQQ